MLSTAPRASRLGIEDVQAKVVPERREGSSRLNRSLSGMLEVCLRAQVLPQTRLQGGAEVAHGQLNVAGLAKHAVCARMQASASPVQALWVDC